MEHAETICEKSKPELLGVRQKCECGLGGGEPRPGWTLVRKIQTLYDILEHIEII